MSPGPPLSTLLSQALVAMTIELDNEFESRFQLAGGGARVTSFVIWANFLRFVDRGISVGDLISASGLPKSRALSHLGGVERWGYVAVGSNDSSRAEKRDGYGGARATKSDWLVGFTAAGERASSIWPALPEEITARWRARFGDKEVRELEQLLQVVHEGSGGRLPDYVPIIVSTNGMALELPAVDRGDRDRFPLIALLAHALLVYTKDFEKSSALSLALSANLLRVLSTSATKVGDLASLAGISQQAVAMSVTALLRTEFISLVGKGATMTVRLTPAGAKLAANQKLLHDEIHHRWEASLGASITGRLRTSLERIFTDSSFSQGLIPHSDGWRASGPYAAHTQQLVADPSQLPHHPMVLPRGGWPDGS